MYAGLPHSWTNNMKSVRMRILCRLLAAVPPLIGAGFLREVALCTQTNALLQPPVTPERSLTCACDMAAVIQLTGLSGFFIGYIIPGFLLHFAVKVPCSLATSLVAPCFSPLSCVCVVMCRVYRRAGRSGVRLVSARPTHGTSRIPSTFGPSCSPSSSASSSPSSSSSLGLSTAFRHT